MDRLFRSNGRFFVQLNPQTNQKDIFTAVFSDDGLSYSEITPLGFPVEKDEPAWGVPDAVLMPNGLIRVYWVYIQKIRHPMKNL